MDEDDETADNDGEKCLRASQSFTRIKLNEKFEKWNCCGGDFISPNRLTKMCAFRFGTRVEYAQVKWNSVLHLFRCSNSLRSCVGGDASIQMYSINSIISSNPDGFASDDVFSLFFLFVRWILSRRISSCLLILLTMYTGYGTLDNTHSQNIELRSKHDNDNHAVLEITSVIFPEMLFSFLTRQI